MLLPLGVKFVPEESEESDQDSEEEPELNQSPLGGTRVKSESIRKAIF